MEAQQQGQKTDKQRAQVTQTPTGKLPHWVRPVAITIALIFFAIAGVIWIWGVRNDLEKVMTALFAVLGVVCTFFAIPFLYSSSDSEPSSANTAAASQPPISITISPSITVSPNMSTAPSRNTSSQAPPVEPNAPHNIGEKSPSIDTTNIQQVQKPVTREEQIEAKPTQVPSESVFLINMLLTDPEDFYGRKLKRTTLINRARNGASTSITGPRRIGKTWLMSYLRLVAPTQLGSNFHIGYMDVTMPSCATVAGFTTEALKALGFPLLSTLTNPGLAMLEGFVKDMVAKNEIPILCIDEFEGFTHHQDFDLNFFTQLRAITQVGLGLVVASKDALIDIVSEKVKTSPFFNVFLQLKLGPFDTEDAKKFAQDKGAQAGFTNEERAYLLKYGQKGEQQWPPLRLQLVGEMLLEDKRLAASEGSHYYRPDDPDYWIEFKERLEETYQAAVKQ